MLGLATGKQGLDGGALLAGKATGADGVQDDVALDVSVLAAELESSESGDDDLGILVSFVGQEPTGRLGQENHGHADEETEDDLERDGESPREVVAAVAAAVVDPVRDHGTECDDAAFDADEQSSVGGFTAFSCGELVVSLPPDIQLRTYNTMDRGI